MIDWSKIEVDNRGGGQGAEKRYIAHVSVMQAKGQCAGKHVLTVVNHAIGRCYQI